MKQGTIGDFGGGAEDAARPSEEAAAVAGADGTDSGADVVDVSDHRFPDADGHVELSVTQVDYTIEGNGDDEHPVLHVFGRAAEDETVHVRVYGFRPYFYTPISELDLAADAEDPLTERDIIDSRLDHDRLAGIETYGHLESEGNDIGDHDPAEAVVYESIRGEDLLKVFGQTPRDVGQLRDRFEHYEADILFPNRLLIDKDIKSGVRVPVRELDDGSLKVHHTELSAVELSVEPRVHTLDIEVDDRHGFPEDGEQTIICLTSHDSGRDEYVIWLYESPEGISGPEAIEEYDPLGEGPLNVDVRAFSEEAEMLVDYLDYIDETNPDVLTGWNFDDFDAPYLIDRIDRLDSRHDRLDSNRLSRVNEVWDSGWGGPNIKGRVVFDLLYAYQRTQFSELDSYRLDAVGEEELGVGKERYTGDIGDLWEDDPERLLEYNLRDVELCVELDRKQNIVDFWEEVASFVGCKLEDATTPGDAVDMYVLHEIHGEFALPSKGQQESEDYEGGAVFDPITGVKEMVSVLDLKCFSADTDVATPDGLRNIRDLEIGDPIYTLNPETFECEVKPVVDTQSYDNEYGELHHVSGNTHDFKVTENHRFLLSKTRGWDDLDPGDFEFAEYRDVPDSERFAFPNHEPIVGTSRDRFRLFEDVENGYAAVYADDGLSEFRSAIPAGMESALEWANGTSRLAATEEKTGKYLIPVDTYREHREIIEEEADEVFLKYDRGHAETPTSFPMNDWLELVGWFVTEGSLIRETPGIVLHQQSQAGRDSIRDLLDRMDLNYSADESAFYISNTFLHDWLLDQCGDGYAEKRLPEWVFDLDAAHLQSLMETLVDGDGMRTDSGLRTFWTKSDQLKADIVRLAIHCGEKPTVSRQSDGTWYVSIGKQGSMKKANAAVEPHDGQVHCVTAKDNHVVLAGRNGHLQWVGQSLYPMCMVTVNASPETKVDPESYDDETYVAPNGTHFRKEPDGMIREMVDELLAEREQKKSLRNEHDPGSDAYDTYDRQQSAVKVIMNCFTPDTDVLTPAGVRNIRDLEVGDEVYSLNPETMEMERKPVVETHAYPDYRGELVDIETSKIDFGVTPNHRMLVRKNETNGITEDDYQFVEAGDLDDATNYEFPHDWDGPDGNELDEVDLTERLDCEYEVWANNDVHGHTLAAEVGFYPDKILRQDVDDTGYVFSATEFDRHREYLNEACSEFYLHGERGRKWIPRFYDGDDFLDLLAWYITEGNVYTSSEKQFGENLRGSSTTVNIAQDAVPDGGESDAHATIGTLLDQMGFDYDVDEKGYQFTSRLLGEWLEGTCGADSFEKRIPEFVFELGQRQKRCFLETLIAGDGDRQPNSWRYSTSSESLRDGVLRLCAHLGLTASYSEDSGVYRVHVTEDAKNTLRMHRSAERTTADDGVYCVTVADNHTLLAGRNGTFQFVGQSLYGVLGWDRFRLYDKEMGAAVTATGREVIEFTEQAADELDKQVIYGDTDSIMLELEHDITKEEAIEQSFEIEAHINDAYDEFAAELNAAEHRFDIEFEKLYRRFFQAGKKKRYAGHIIWKEGKDVDDLDITGFEYKRSDIAPITKEVQKKVLEMVVTGTDPEDIKDYVHEVIERVQAGDVSLDEIGIPGGIGKKLDNYDTDTAQVRGAKYANLLLGTNFASGSKPKRVYLKKVHPEFFREVESEMGLDPSEDPLYGEFKRDPDVICFEFDDQVPDAFEVDYEKMLDKTLKGPIARILEALDISWNEVKTGQEQTGLGSYM
ncbi:MAG: DNA polymerase I [Natronomonas sp.]|jgi:DNA polymerase I|uniref:DNA polymerase domain-containing protein n=1 Tax=Natronomonas sp. TaxID=2184060 RepID=UPI003989C338